MSLKQQIEGDIKKAMLAKQKDELTALRSIKSLILLAETEKGSQDVLSEDQEMKLLMKAAKQRKDSAGLYQEKGREDLASKELLELEVINRYLPKQLSEDELKEALKAIITEIGASGPQDMGKVMGAATKKLAGKADGKTISSLVKTILQN
ncbi:GatB/YqeY domain-containing protein [Fulvivirgaceae bacterium BMA12]|uniref:GatB/YqeY domain-containing protein n=1 Tax=Agaribacillus aureus TaxID=3051825 RepID=A0ABT8LDA7_9BACT|nr:GatB/YqeY domain-containing protein [Fulvivirgaceae bacterium BMA12]